MTLEQQVTSFELSKRLKELGVKQESLFYYAPFKGKLCPVYINDLRRGTSLPIKNYISAFTVSELGEMLKDQDLECIWFHEHNKYGAYQTCSGLNPFFDDTEADARAKMLIYLLENSLITL